MSTAELLDDFQELGGWSAVASGRARLDLSQEDGPRGKAMRLDFDFHGGGGFVVARKRFARALPSRYAFRFNLRGSAPANRIEWKLVDASGDNVWWHHRDAFALPADWSPMRISSSDIEFAWGPAGGGAATQLGAVELAIVAGPGGRGSMWIDDLRLEDLSYRGTPVVRASSAAPGHPPERALDGARDTGWRSTTDEPQWLAIDFGEEREIGALVVHWEPGLGARAFDAEVSDDGALWTALGSQEHAAGARSYFFTPGASARHLRLVLRECAGECFGICAIEALPHALSRGIAAFFQSVAAREPRGWFPRYLHAEQSHWTPVGVPGAAACALLDEAGMLEVDRGSFSLEPFALIDGELASWADADLVQELAAPGLPIPSSVWRARGVRLAITAWAAGDPVRAELFVRYRVENTQGAPRSVRLFVAIRPFQVTPPWQSFRGLGGASPIRGLAYRDGWVWVNGSPRVLPLAAPTGFGAAAFEEGALGAYLAAGELPPRREVSDAFGHASGALQFDLELPPGAAREVHLVAPQAGAQRGEVERRSNGRAASFAQRAAGERRPADELAAATAFWEQKLAAVTFRVPDSAGAAIDALRTATAHILIVRDGAALQPGPRRYARSWIRDAATMSAALLRMGCRDEVRDFLRWYAPHQAADGNVPCCVDRGGPDWLPEHDSHGQLVFTAAEHFRFTGDRALLAELWPHLSRAADYLERLRSERLTSAFAEGERRSCYGILPESVSHEGYLAQPVHAYWDDFWALRGLSDAADAALALGRDQDAARLSEARDSLRECVYASIAATMAERRLDTIPASVEWADFDPSATAVSLVITDAATRLPAEALARTYDQYLAGLRARRAGERAWSSYTPYEIRIIGALVRIGRRAEAHELLDGFLADRRPRAWNQWPEILWRDPRSPGHLGDLPHAWVGAEYVLAVLALFAFERPADRALVLAAGIADGWLAGGREVAIAGLPTYYGALDYRLRRAGDDTLIFTLGSELAAPEGGIVVQPPLPRPLRSVEVDGRRATGFAPDRVRLEHSPATVVMKY